MGYDKTEDDYVELAQRINRGDLVLGLLPLETADLVVAGLTQAGSARAWRELGLCYLGVSGDHLPPYDGPESAMRCFEAAAALGDRDGAMLFAQSVRDTPPPVRQRALDLLRPHARADAAAAYQLGLLEQWLDRPGAAIEHHLRAAGLGDGDAAFELYVLFATGTGVERDDAESRRWLERAVELGQPRALYNMGAAHATGEGAPQDMALAVSYYERAADAGNARAAATLGVMYLTGGGVAEDPDRAAQWLDLADELGHPVDEWLGQLRLQRP